MIRLDKYLADCGIGTRSEVKKYIKAKQITVNDTIVSKAEMKINESNDIVCFKGQKIVYEKYVYYLFHKPAGCVTAKQDNLHRTVMDYFPEEICEKGIAPVGRLDLDTEGLLLLTNDGPLTHHLLSPTHHVPKTYYAILDKEVPAETIEKFKAGVDIGDDKLTLPAELEICPIENKEGETIYSAKLTIHEGRFHQVKRMFETAGCTVTYLKRLSMGDFTLGNLEKGEYRKLSEEEIQQISTM
jgi:16S rRNA pseudouridine516 synthase